MEKIPAYIQLLEISDTLRGLNYKRELVSEEYIDDNTLQRSSTGLTTSMLRNQFTQITLDWAHELSNAAILFVFKHIVHELKMMNLLWHRLPTRKTAENRIIKELIDKQIIFRTEAIGMYLVNPTRMWRGTVFSAVEATKTLLREHGKPRPELVHDLRPNKEYKLMTNQDRINKMLGTPGER